jgi:hypothetical protein
LARQGFGPAELIRSNFGSLPRFNVPTVGFVSAFTGCNNFSDGKPTLKCGVWSRAGAGTGLLALGENKPMSLERRYCLWKGQFALLDDADGIIGIMPDKVGTGDLNDEYAGRV